MLFRDPSLQAISFRGYETAPALGIEKGNADKPSAASLDEHAKIGAQPQTRTVMSDDKAPGRVEISPPDMVTRHMVARESVAVEIVQSVTSARIEHTFCADRHLLVVCEEGVRQDGETILGDLYRSRLRNMTHKLTFVPAGQAYRDWQQPRTPMLMTYFYFAPAAFETLTDGEFAAASLRPRLLFEDKTLLDSALKLKRLAESPARDDHSYFDALCAVLIHEIIRLDRAVTRSEAPVRGGLAVWQQRAVATFIEDHLTQTIPLQTLAQLARLSPHYFCRAFKQSFGLPPHRYHSIRRIERAKTLLASSNCSVTEIGMRLGFSETSSFSTAFRKVTGLTPTEYHRSLG